jgi:hypothetical protein
MTIVALLLKGDLLFIKKKALKFKKMRWITNMLSYLSTLHKSLYLHRFL